MKKIIWLGIVAAITALILLVSGCGQSDADVASHNVSKAADNFEVMRRVVFVNGITDKYLLEIVGLCSLGNNDPVQYITVTCKTGPKSYKKHILARSDNVTVVAQQLESVSVSTARYRVIFKPETLIPDIDLR